MIEPIIADLSRDVTKVVGQSLGHFQKIGNQDAYCNLCSDDGN